MNVMPRSIAACTRRVDSRSVFGRPRCQPPSASIDTGIPVRPNGRVGTSADDVFIPPPRRTLRAAPRHTAPPFISGRAARSAGPAASRADHRQSSCCFPKRARVIVMLETKRRLVAKTKSDVQQGTLALMVLKTLEVLGPLHGCGLARRIEQISGDLLAVNQGTLYPLLLKLEQEGAIASEWAASENNRRARFYRLTAAGRRQLQAER